MQKAGFLMMRLNCKLHVISNIENRGSILSRQGIITITPMQYTVIFNGCKFYMKDGNTFS